MEFLISLKLVCYGTHFMDNFCALDESGTYWKIPANESNINNQFNFFQLYFPVVASCENNSKWILEWRVSFQFMLSDCHMYMTPKRYPAAGSGSNLLVSETGSFWAPPAEGTPVGPNSGYVKVINATCGGCDAIRFPPSKCNAIFKPAAQSLTTSLPTTASSAGKNYFLIKQFFWIIQNFNGYSYFALNKKNKSVGKEF